jgi:hypothetical protein
VCVANITFSLGELGNNARSRVAPKGADRCVFMYVYVYINMYILLFCLAFAEWMPQSISWVPHPPAPLKSLGEKHDNTSVDLRWKT